jgi:hypothetical protein
VPGKTIVIPEHPEQIRVQDIPLVKLRASYIRNCVAASKGWLANDNDLLFLSEETKTSIDDVRNVLKELG